MVVPFIRSCPIERRTPMEKRHPSTKSGRPANADGHRHASTMAPPLLSFGCVRWICWYCLRPLSPLLCLTVSFHYYARWLLRSLITDVQYADVEDGWNYARTDQRFYRNALVLLKQAIGEWIDHTDGVETASGVVVEQKKPIKFAIDLGDLIDGKNRGANTTQAALADVKAACQVFEERVGPVHHLLGNHELYNMSQVEFEKELTWPKAKKAYYDFTMPEHAPRARFIVLNSYGISSLGRQEGETDPIFREARRRLREVNHNSDLNSPLGLKRDEVRFVEYNGAMDDEQLAWLRSTLQQSSANGEDVIIFSHIPVHPKSCPWNCLMWNYQEVLDTILNVASCVRAVFSGHVHVDGYAKEKGIHFLVTDAVLECNPSRNETAHAIVDLHADRIVVNGFGKVPTRELKFARVSS